MECGTTIFYNRIFGAPEGTRTPDPLLRRQLLYPPELQARIVGAGDGNRTHVISLEGWSSTIELHPQIKCFNILAYTKKSVKAFCLFIRYFSIKHPSGCVRGVFTVVL